MKQIPFFMTLVLFVFFSSTITLFAQNDENTLAAEHKAISGVIKDFTKSFSEISETGDKESVLQYFEEQFTSDLTFVRIGSTVRNSSGNYERLSAQLENLINSKDMKITYDIQEISKYALKGTIAVVPFVTNFEVKQGDEVVMKGSQLFTFTLRKSEDKWRVVHYTVTEIEDQRNKGACICELFEEQSRNINLVSKITFPSGSDYKTEFDEFTFKKVDAGTMILLRTGKTTHYLLDNNKMVHVLDANDKPIQELGKAENSSEAVLLILQTHIYNSNCLRILRRK